MLNGESLFLFLACKRGILSLSVSDLIGLFTVLIYNLVLMNWLLITEEMGDMGDSGIRIQCHSKAPCWLRSQWWALLPEGIIRDLPLRWKVSSAAGNGTWRPPHPTLPLLAMTLSRTAVPALQPPVYLACFPLSWLHPSEWGFTAQPWLRGWSHHRCPRLSLLELQSPPGLSAPAEEVWECALCVPADQSPLWRFSAFEGCGDQGNLLEERDCKENNAKRATTIIR